MIGLTTFEGLNDWLSDQLLILVALAELNFADEAEFTITIGPWQRMKRTRYDVAGYPVTLSATGADDQRALHQIMSVREDLDGARETTGHVIRALKRLDIAVRIVDLNVEKGEAQ